MGAERGVIREGKGPRQGLREYLGASGIHSCGEPCMHAKLSACSRPGQPALHSICICIAPVCVTVLLASVYLLASDKSCVLRTLR